LLNPASSPHFQQTTYRKPDQSAYCKHHSTETALLNIHDYLINATGSQKVPCLCLLDLSAAFGTIHHNPSLSSWFGMALFSAGSSLAYHFIPSMLNVITTSRPLIIPLLVFPNFPRLCSRPSTLGHVHHPSQYSDLFPFP